MDIIIHGHEFFYDITSMSMLFFPGEKTNIVDKSNEAHYIVSKLIKNNDKCCSFTEKYRPL